MIISKDIEITLNPSNMKYYSSLGYYYLKSGAKLIVPVQQLNKGSNAIVIVKCDICGKEKELKYRFYLKAYNKQKFYTCSSKCSRFKVKNTCIQKYGKPYYSQTEQWAKDVEETSQIKYGVSNASQSLEKQTNRKETMQKKYGVDYYVLSEDFKIKSKETSIKNYGKPHPQMSSQMKEKRLDYHKKMGFNITSKDFELYKNKVYLLTKKNKSKLLETWDGLDYYDGEYIRDNFSLPYHDKYYPTIDHRTSIFEGYKNGISVETIAALDNLCFTKRFINSKKYNQIEKNFIYLGTLT